MVTTTPAAAAARLHSRGALLYTPPGPASTSCTGRVGRSLALGATSRARQQQAVVAAAAVLSNEQQRQTGYDSSSDVGQAVSLALDPSVWLEAERAASAAAAITGAASSAFFRPGRSQHSSNNQQRQGQYLGVYNTHEASSIPGKQPHASTPPHSAATAPSGKGSKSKGKAVRQAAAGPPTSGGVAAETLQLNSSRPRTRQLRQRNRSARPSPGRRAMHGAFDNILQVRSGRFGGIYEQWAAVEEGIGAPYVLHVCVAQLKSSTSVGTTAVPQPTEVLLLHPCPAVAYQHTPRAAARNTDTLASVQDFLTNRA